MQNKGHFAVQGHSRSLIFVPIESSYTTSYQTIARPVLRIKSWIYQSARNLYRGRRALSLQTFTTRRSNRKLSIVVALSTTFTQYAPEISKFGKIRVFRHSLSFKDTDFGTNRKLIYDFLGESRYPKGTVRQTDRRQIVILRYGRCQRNDWTY